MWLNLRLSLLVLGLALVCSGCLGPRQNLFPPRAADTKKSVWVVSHGWHTGLVIPRAEIPAGLWLEKDDFPQAKYLEVGWGEDGWYRAPKITPFIALKGVFWSNPSVLHVVGFSEPPETNFPMSKIIRVDLTEPGFSNLCAFVSQRYKRDGMARAKPLQKGLYGDSLFYRATGRYYSPKTCNIWTARGLRSAGCPITSAYSMTAGNVLCQTRKFGTVTRWN